MGVVLGFMPWTVYWVLVGNTPVLVAVVVALATAAAILVGSRAKDQPGRAFGLGTVAVFAILVLLVLVADPGFSERWLLPLSNAGLFAVVATSVLIGRSAIREFAVADQPAGVVQSELFDPIVTRLTWLWLGGFAAMTVSSAVPPLVLDAASMLDAQTPWAFICYWVVPFSTLATVGIGSRVLGDRMTVGFDDAVRRTSFVAFIDMEIDQLYYLATEHAKREVGPGQEPCNVTVGAKGTPLLGDETRVSWPSTFKVRERG